MQQSIRSRVDQTADTLQFGLPTAIYQQVFSPSAKRRKYRAIIIYSVAIMVFPSCAFIGSLLSSPWQPLASFICAVLFVTLGIFTLLLVLILLRRMTIPWYVFLYAEGFLSARGRKIEAVRWDQVTAIRQLGPFTDRLSLADGRKFTFDNSFLNLETAHLLDPDSRDLPWSKLRGLEEAEAAPFYDRWGAAETQETELIHRMEREILTRLFPKIVATYQEGLPVAFGRLQISTKGISAGKTTLPWSDVDQITIHTVEGDPEDEDDSVPKPPPSVDSSTLTERLAWWQNEVNSLDTMLIFSKGKRDAFWSRGVALVPNAFLLMELVGYALRQMPS